MIPNTVAYSLLLAMIGIPLIKQVITLEHAIKILQIPPTFKDIDDRCKLMVAGCEWIAFYSKLHGRQV